MRSIHWFAVVSGLACSAAGCAAPYRYAVAVPLADLRAQPGSFAKPETHDPLQETQLLYGERVRLLSTQDAWAEVEALEQREYTHAKRWQGYPGWILKDVLMPLPRVTPHNAIISGTWVTVWSDAQGLVPWFQLPMGTHVTVTSTEGDLWPIRLLSGETGWVSRGQVQRRKTLSNLSLDQTRWAIVRVAEEFLGSPYFWGGRSPSRGPGQRMATGVDCSGLVNLSYRSVGIEIPRDAHEQYLRARKIHTPQAADLIFLSAPGDSRTIVHVMLYAGDGWVIEGPGTGQAVRRITVTERLRRPLDEVVVGDTVDAQSIFFGAYLP